MKRVCAVSGEEFEISRDDLEFYEKMGVPVPTLCPEERLRRRISYRNFHSLYHRTCSTTGKKILSMYDEGVPFPVYDYDYWWSDNWDARSFGRNFDFSRPFFEQYRDLRGAVPRFPIMNTQSENCLFSNFAFYSKNCYLIFGCVHNEDCLYGHIVWESQNCVDNLYAYQCQWCSNCIDIVGCYDVHYSTECVNCRESYFCHDCRNCNNCFGCINLRNQQYCFGSQQLSRKQYQAKMDEMFPLSGKHAAEMTAWLEREKQQKSLYPPAFASQAENVTGNHLYMSENLQHCFDAKKSEQIKYCFTIFEANNSYDLAFGSGRFSLDCLTLLNSEQCLCCHTIHDSHELAYSEFIFSSHDLFGCTGLRRSEYCILNKQYTKEDYFALRARIVEQMRSTGEWGEFFPAADSPFAYNESIVNEYLPLTREEVLARGLRWKDESAQQNGRAPAANPLPQTIDQSTADNIGKAFACEKTGKPYKIIAPEFEFYKRTNLPLPRLCPDARHLERMAQRQRRSLWPRTCPKCSTRFLASFSPEDPHTVLCESCYLAAVQGET